MAEHKLRFFYSAGYAWTIVRRDFEGIRVRHTNHEGSWVEWPVLRYQGIDANGKRRPSKLVWASYSFNGEASYRIAPPPDVLEAVREILQPSDTEPNPIAVTELNDEPLTCSICRRPIVGGKWHEHASE